MFSINAMGTIDKKLIYRKRKGIDDIKKYTKTVNPNLPGQQTQKGYFKEAILAWGSEGYSARDIQAWNLLARTKKVIVSGFNSFASYRINAGKEGLTWSRLTNCIISDVTKVGFKVEINVESDQEGILYIGRSNKAMIKEFEGVFDVDKYTFTVTGLEELTKYYFYIKNTKSGEKARTGIYGQKTTAEEPQVPIDIGNPAIAGIALIGGGNWTLVDKENPANGTGTITTVEIWAYKAIATSIVIATFSANGDILTARDHEVIGPIVEGYNSFVVEIDVVEGDYIGVYYAGPSGEGEPEGTPEVGTAFWFKEGDHTQGIDQTFEVFIDNFLSLGGTGQTG